MKALVWFRKDLRVKDNVTLSNALENFTDIYPVYCFDPREFALSNQGFNRTGPYRAKFLLESVATLKNTLMALGSTLIVKMGDPTEVIPALARELKVKTVLASKEAAIGETNIENLLEQKLWGAGIEFELFWQSTLYNLADIPWPIKRLPEIFTDFRKQAETESFIRDLMPAVNEVRTFARVDSEEIPTLEDLGLNMPEIDSRVVLDFQGGEKAALERLKNYLWETKLLSKYKETRNGLIGANYSSKLSPWLALGCISPRTIYYEVKKYEAEIIKNSSTYWLIFELVWRDYFRFIAKKHGAKLFRVNGIREREIEFNEDKDAFKKWCEGKTSQPFVNANMMELNSTGFMSNRGRQIVASFLAHDLKVKWTWGAAYFESLLIDYDPASNWGNWNYMAGVGNDPRKDRYFNVESQAAKYDPKNEYINLWNESVG